MVFIPGENQFLLAKHNFDQHNDEGDVDENITGPDVLYEGIDR